MGAVAERHARTHEWSWAVKNEGTGIVVAYRQTQEEAFAEKDRIDHMYAEVEPPWKSPLVVEAVKL